MIAIVVMGDGNTSMAQTRRESRKSFPCLVLTHFSLSKSKRKISDLPSLGIDSDVQPFRRMVGPESTDFAPRSFL
jgi:hypothetical protein